MIYNEAYRFIKSKVKNEIFKMHLEHYEDLKFESMNDIFKRMIITLKNRKGRLKMIVPIKEIDDILFGFDSKKVFKEYLYWKELCQEFKRKFGEKYKIDISNKRNVWVQFSMGIISCARYLEL